MNIEAYYYYYYSKPTCIHINICLYCYTKYIFESIEQESHLRNAAYEITVASVKPVVCRFAPPLGMTAQIFI